MAQQIHTIPSQPAPARPKVLLRPPNVIIPPTCPPEHRYLHGLSPSLPGRIAFLHPGYDDPFNVLLTLRAHDSPEGGIHFGLAHTACAIVANNRWDGWLSTSVTGVPKIQLEWDDVLP